MNWYTGNSSISQLAFSTCDLLTIESDAFIATALQNITHLAFDDRYSRNIVYQKDFLRGLPALECLTLQRVVFTSTDEHFLQPIAQHLVSLTLSNSTTIQFLQHIFSRNTTFEHLQMLCITSTQALQLLTAQTFGHVTAIVILDLHASGIMSIEQNAFDAMSDTLRELYLQYNRLQTLPPDLFANMRLFFSLVGNPWQCQCYLLKLQEIIAFMGPELLRRCNIDRCRHIEAELQQLDLRLTRWCIHHPGTESLYVNLPKFTITIVDVGRSQRFIHIDSLRWQQVDKFYVLVIVLKSFVFENEFEAFCYVAHRRAAPIRLPINLPFDGNDADVDADTRTQGQPHIVHVMDTLRHVWPMNIAAVRPIGLMHAWLLNDEMLMVLAMTLAGMAAAFLIGCLGGFLLLCRYPILIKDLDRVVVLSNRNVGGGKRKTHVFIMPENWKKPTVKDKIDVEM